MGRLARDWHDRDHGVRYRSFKKARAFVRGLGLKSGAEWRDYCKSGKKPDDIPANPRARIRGSWLGRIWAIGSGLARSPTHLRQYRSFKEARAFVRGLGLKSEAEWRDYCKSGKKPDDIPANPNQNIRGGWLGWNGRLARDWHGRHRAYVNIDPSRKLALSCAASV